MSDLHQPTVHFGTQHPSRYHDNSKSRPEITYADDLSLRSTRGQVVANYFAFYLLKDFSNINLDIILCSRLGLHF
jgi:hypothetical protein